MRYRPNIGLIYGRLIHTGIILVIMLAMALAIMAEGPGRRYVGSQRSDKYHLPDCKWANRIKASNQIWFDTIAEAKAAGYRACSVCKPEGAAATVGDEVIPEPTEQRQEPSQAERVSQRVQSRPMGRQSLSGSNNAWLYWLIGILLFLGLLTWWGLHKPKKQRQTESQQWLEKHLDRSIPNNPYQQWLQKHIDGLPEDMRVKLIELRQEQRGKPIYPQNWRATSTEMRRKQTNCEVCGALSEHVHHRKYSKFGIYELGDLIVLCAMCHYWIHPHANMSQEAYINGE